MPNPRKPETPAKPRPRPGAASGVALKIRRGKADLSDEELTKVSGGQSSHKQFTNIDP